MAEPIEFYFDFSSPYGYFAARLIDDVAAEVGRTVAWKPIMIGAAFKESGNKPLMHQPLKGDYCVADWARLGRYYDVPWTLPESFPIATLAAARAFYWLEGSDPALAVRFAKAAFHAYFGEGRDISPAATVAEIARPLGIASDELMAATQSGDAKERLKQETETAIGRGVFGSPFFFVDGEGFWGVDRLWMVKEWITKGGW